MTKTIQKTSRYKMTVSWFKRSGRFYAWQQVICFDYNAWRFLGKFDTAQEAVDRIKQEKELSWISE